MEIIPYPHQVKGLLSCSMHVWGAIFINKRMKQRKFKIEVQFFGEV
jgi:hypothetical protein